MPNYEATDVFYLDSKKAVETFCHQLQKMKEDAPVSLTLTVAVTVNRQTTIRVQDTSVPKAVVPLKDLQIALSKIQKKSLPITTRPAKKRSLDPADRGY